MSGKVLITACNPSLDHTIFVDRFTACETNRALHSRTDCGGKGVNVAKVLRNFQLQPLLTGFVGGNAGETLTNFLSQIEIEHDFITIPGETRTNLKIVEQSNQLLTEINEPGCPVPANALARFNDKYRQLIQQCDLVVLSGSLPPGVPPDFYASCITAAKQHGKKVLLDADGTALHAGICALPFAVKPNLAELECLMGRRLSGADAVVEAAQALIRRGIALVIVSMGSAGAIVAMQNHTLKADCWPICARGPVGAGDSMVAALAYAILQAYSLDDIARITTAAGTVTASKPGTGVCSLKEVHLHLHDIALKAL